jgi:hypothetical protein
VRWGEESKDPEGDGTTMRIQGISTTNPHVWGPSRKQHLKTEHHLPRFSGFSPEMLLVSPFVLGENGN